MMVRSVRHAVWLLLFSGAALFSAMGAESSGKNAPTGVWRGVFEPNAEAIIPSEQSMPVMSLPRRPGESCVRGDVLVEFDSTIRKAGLESAHAKLKAVELNHAGMRNLYAGNQATAIELAKAESEVAQVRLEVAAAEKALDACTVVAPFSGRVVESRTRQYEWASQGAPLLLLVDDTVLKAHFFLPEARFSAIAIGDRVRVRVPAASRHAWGTVSRLGVVFDPVSRTFDVWADVPNTDDAFRAGMTAEVEWPVAEGTAP